MCDFISELKAVTKALVTECHEFDMLDIRNLVREAVGPTVPVGFRDCKFETLALFEQGNFPGYVLTTKRKEVLVPVIWEGIEGNELQEQSVFSFVPFTSILDSLLPLAQRLPKV